MHRWLVCFLLIACITQAETKSGLKTSRRVLPPKPVKPNPFQYVEKPTTPGPVVQTNFMGFLGKNPFLYVNPIIPAANEVNAESIASEKSAGKESTQIKVSPSKVSPALDRFTPL